MTGGNGAAPGAAGGGARADGIIERAQRFLANGYLPIPVLGPDAPAEVVIDGKRRRQTPGKQPHGGLWRDKEKAIYGATSASIAAWSRRRGIEACTNLGIACGVIVCVDIDVYEPDLAEQIEERLAVAILGKTQLRRYGRRPKVALVYRSANGPLAKVQTPEFRKGELKAKVEVLGRGQQLVALGIHPDTRAPYEWPDASPETLPAAELPTVTKEQIETFVRVAEALLRAHGYRTKREIEAEQTRQELPPKLAAAKPGTKGSAFRAVNGAALQSPDAWVPLLFPSGAYKDGRSVWRVPSSALGRDREEDLSIAPDGIVDFGEHDMGDPQAGKRTAIDLVMEHGGAPNALEAARWLADKLGRRPEDFGFEAAKARKQPHGRSSASEEASTVPAGERPTIRITGGRLHEQADEAERHLAAATHANPARGVYVRGSMLVRAARLKGEKTGHGIKRPIGSLVLTAVEADYLRGRLTEICRWERFDKKAGEWVSTDAHGATIALLLAVMPWEQLPGLTGIIEAPTLRPDGSLLAKPGYDEATGLLFVPGETVFPEIPDKPTREQAAAALELLKRPFAAFPFAGEAARAVAISSVMTVLVRRVLRAAPMHVYSAPKMASGKTLLATIPAYVATGRAPYLISQAMDPESERKRLLAVLIEGPPLIVIDNVEKALKSDALSTVLTEPTFTDRLLGASRTLTVPTNCMVAATGNNLVLHGDLSARGLLCELDPACERPEEREFDLDLHEWVPAHRGELAAAALTIMRAYLAAGAPKQDIKNYARFETWSRWVRSPLVWLGMNDPCETRAKIETADPVRGQLRDLLTELARFVWTGFPA